VNTITLAIYVVTIVSLWGLRKYVHSRREERDHRASLARDAWQARRTARAAAKRKEWIDGG